jgi:polar amino acid transport system substrate-binding protein
MQRTLKKFGLFLVFVLVNIVAFVPAQAGEVLNRIRREGVLKTPVPDIWPPGVIRTTKGELDGFDISVLREIGRRIGVKISYINHPNGTAITWSEQTSGQWQGQYDIVLNSMTPTAKRAEHLVFPVSYYNAITVVAVHRANKSIKSPFDLAGKRVGVLKASHYQMYLQRQPFGIVDLPAFHYKIDNPVVVEYDHEEGAYEALSKGDGVEIDATINLLPVILNLIKQGKPLKVIGQPIYRVPQAVAIQPGDAEFAELMKKTITDMQLDGTLKALSIKWFEYDLTVQ